jgi:hypothetical protein
VMKAECLLRDRRGERIRAVRQGWQHECHGQLRR